MESALWPGYQKHCMAQASPLLSCPDPLCSRQQLGRPRPSSAPKQRETWPACPCPPSLGRPGPDQLGRRGPVGPALTRKKRERGEEMLAV